MLAILVLAASIAATSTFPDPVRVEVGRSVEVDVDVTPVNLINGGSVFAEDPSVAGASGWIPFLSSNGRATVSGITPGQTRLMVESLVGWTIWHHPVGVVIVEEACVAPSVTLPVRSLRIDEGKPVTLQAMTSGSQPLTVSWHDGDERLGVANPLTVTLPRGVHRL